MGLIYAEQIKLSEVSPPAKGVARTPDSLADTLVRAIGTNGDATWLDPSAGSGQLVQAAIRSGVNPRSILAIDLQTQLPSLKQLGVKALLGTDFLKWAQETDQRFDRVIANPPFVRLSALQAELLESALTTRFHGVTTSRKSNYWVAFLLAGMALLKDGGSLAFVLPAAWEYANYAGPIRELCAISFQELTVHRVSKPMFEQVSDGSVLLVGHVFGKTPNRKPLVARHATLADLNRSVYTGLRHRPVGSKKPKRQELICSRDFVQLGEIADVRIGAVTGDANYFLLTEDQRIDLGLPKSSVRPVLSKSDHIAGSEIDYDVWRALLLGGKRVWLFDPPEQDLTKPSVRAYLHRTLAEGGCNRNASKVVSRYPWYRVVVPARFDGFATGMSPTVPWVGLNLMPKLSVSNTLYGLRFRNVPSIDERAAWCLSMLSSKTAWSRTQKIREYPQGLLKLEPGDLARLLVPRPRTSKGARLLYKKAVELIKAEGLGKVRSLVDDWLEQQS